MSFKRSKPYYNTPLNVSKTIDLPSNLLRGRPSTRYHELTTAHLFSPPPSLNATVTVTPRPELQPIQAKGEEIAMVEEKEQTRKSVLYKRLSEIKSQNNSLEKYSYSKLLSKMMVIDEPDLLEEAELPKHRVNLEFKKQRASSDYNCLQGRLLSIDCEEDRKEGHPRRNQLSRAEDYANRTTRIFKRFYMPSSQIGEGGRVSQTANAQKFIYINGKKTECRRIHNFYGSQNYRTSYGKAFGHSRISPQGCDC